MARWPQIDVVINNHNYGRYLGAAIESALAQTYEPVEVIVVDDGSSDDSRQVIAGFSGQVEAIFKENGGQASAFNAGLAVSSGDVVIFLDADDLLLPHAAERIAARFRSEPGLAKLHYRLAVADEDGRPTGELKPPPHIALPSGDLTTATLRFGFDLARPATSGSAYASTVLRSIAPIRDRDGIGADWYVVHLAALFGPVAAIDDALALYRLHGDNRHEGAGETLDLDRLRATIRYTAWTRALFGDYASRLGLDYDPGNAAMCEVADRAISLKLDPPCHPCPDDSLPALVGLGIRAAHRRFDIAAPMKAAFVAWLVCIAVAPRRVAWRLAEWFVYPSRRSALNGWLQRMNRRR